jgi:hypothetical protein
MAKMHSPSQYQSNSSAPGLAHALPGAGAAAAGGGHAPQATGTRSAPRPAAHGCSNASRGRMHRPETETPSYKSILETTRASSTPAPRLVAARPAQAHPRGSEPQAGGALVRASAAACMTARQLVRPYGGRVGGANSLLHILASTASRPGPMRPGPNRATHAVNYGGRRSQRPRAAVFHTRVRCRERRRRSMPPASHMAGRGAGQRLQAIGLRPGRGQPMHSPYRPARLSFKKHVWGSTRVLWFGPRAISEGGINTRLCCIAPAPRQVLPPGRPPGGLGAPGGAKAPLCKALQTRRQQTCFWWHLTPPQPEEARGSHNFLAVLGHTAPEAY